VVAGVTPVSASADLADADALVVGSALKNDYTDTGEVDDIHSRELVQSIRELTPRARATMRGGRK
jgi:predicted TIM-barrel enzyme